MLSTQDRYELLEAAGQGGSGIVYRARDRQTNQLVAFKMQSAGASPAERQFWDRLVRLMAQLNDPGLVRLLDSGETEGHSFLVFEWVEGKTLAEVLEHTPRLPLRLALFVACSVLRTLEALHGQNVIHRDIKPANIFLVGNLDQAGPLQVKLSDLGVAFQGEGTGLGWPEDRAIVGTPAYMPPEQWNQGGEVGPAADLYAVGCTLYEMLCGQRPFSAPTVDELPMQHLLAPRPDPRRLRPEVPEELALLVQHLMAIAPRDRPTSARSARQALETIALGSVPNVPAQEPG